MSQRDFSLTEASEGPEGAPVHQGYSQIVGPPGEDSRRQQPGVLGAPPAFSAQDARGAPVGAGIAPVMFMEQGCGGPLQWHDPASSGATSLWGQRLPHALLQQQRGPLVQGSALPADDPTRFGGGGPLMQRALQASGEGLPSMGPPPAAEGETVSQWGHSVTAPPWGGGPSASSPPASASPASSALGMLEGPPPQQQAQAQQPQQFLTGDRSLGGGPPGAPPAASVQFDAQEEKSQLKCVQGGRFYKKPLQVSPFCFAKGQPLAEEYRGSPEAGSNPGGVYAEGPQQQSLPYLPLEGGPLQHPGGAAHMMLPSSPDSRVFRVGASDQLASAEGAPTMPSEKLSQRLPSGAAAKRDLAAPLQDAGVWAVPAALQGCAGGPLFAAEGQTHAAPWPFKNAAPLGYGVSTGGPWLGFPTMQGLMAGAMGAPQGPPPPLQGTSPLLWGPGPAGVSQQAARGLLRQGSVGLREFARGPPDCLHSAVTMQQHALVAVRAFLLSCEEPIAPPWKQIASWIPWLTGQQQGPPHAGFQNIRRTGLLKRQERDATMPEAGETVSNKPTDEGSNDQGPQVERTTLEATEEIAAAAAAAPVPSADEELLKSERRRKRGGATPSPVLTAKKALKAQRTAAAGGDATTSAHEMCKEDFLQSLMPLPLPLTALQQSDLCLELLMALGRLRPQWRRRGNRVPFQLHVARLRPSLLLPTTPPSTSVLEAYRTILGPLVAHLGELPFTHLAPGEADEVVQEVELLRGPQFVDSAARALEAPADGLGRDPGDAEVLLAYNPDLKTLRQLNYLVPGTRVYIHLDVLDAKLAEMGLPPLPPQPSGGSGEEAPPSARGPLSKFVIVEAGERYFTVPYGEYLPLKLVSPPHHVLHFPVGRVVQLLQEGRLCLLRFTEREALKRRLPLLGGSSGPPNDAAVGGGGGLFGFKSQRGSKPACCPAPLGIEKICKCKCNHRRQELYGQLKQRLRTDRKACLAAMKDCPDLNHVAFALPSARTYQLEVLSYLFGVDPWHYAKNRHEAPPKAEIPNIIRRYKELVTSREYEQAFKNWLEEQAREKCLQQITADITAIGLNLKEGDGSCLSTAANPAQQDPRVQASISQLTPNTPICVRVKALLGLPSGNEQHLRGVVRRVQMLPRGRAISISINNRKEEFVLLPEDVETLVAHDDLRLVRMRSRQWFAYEAHGPNTGASNITDAQWLSSTQEESWKGDVQSAG
ncbi:hypothetical protein cyc_00040 [Cyclospora cayetanensis]|uniref:Uncharacterized protein n=1 Tax=Cyclospora cayetanensis TaxID=88456 RepID=A0A1D3CSG9_9EIME|nr:hypothetical protein cyc_00040 [Cyclospora cayetanensis]